MAEPSERSPTFSEGEEAAGTSSPPSTFRREPPRSRPGPPLASQPPRTGADSSHELMQDGGCLRSPPALPSQKSDTCLVCELQDGIFTCRFRGHMVHGNCMNAIRAMNRLVGADLVRRREADREFSCNLPKWRERVMILLARPGERRTPAQRMAVRSAVLEDYTGSETHKDTLHLPYGRFIAYKMHWDRLTEREAQASWFELIAQQSNDQEDSDGEPTVPVRDVWRTRTIVGTRTTTTTKRTPAGAGTPTAEGIAAGSSSSRCSENGERSARKRPAEDLGGCAFADEEDMFATPDGKRRNAPSVAEGSLSSGTLQAHIAAMQKRPRPMQQAFAAASSEDIGEPRQVHLLQSRVDLIKEVKLALEDALSAKSPYNILEKKLKQCPPEVRQQMELDGDAVLQKLVDGLIDPLRRLSAEVKTIKLANVEGAKDGLAPPPSPPLA